MFLKPIASFKVRNEKELYRKVYDMDWSSFFSTQNTFQIKTTVNSRLFKHSHFVALKVKDAIVDRFRDDFKIRPNVDLEKADIKIAVHINREKVTISLDSSGEGLFKRGYRTGVGKAPLNEVLAAGLLLLSGWDKQSTFIDPNVWLRNNSY